MPAMDDITLNLIKLSDGNKVLRITEPRSGISVQRRIDREQPILEQKRQLLAALERTQTEEGRETPELSAKQEELWQLLQDIQTAKYRLADWYLGALYAISNSYNPDRFAQAAESLREVLEKIPLAITGDTSGQRRERIARNFVATDPLWTALPANVRDRNVAFVFGIGKELENFAHHSSAEGKRPFTEVLADFEDSLWRILAPATAEHQEQIQQILSRHPDDADVQQLLQLIKSRGANFSFFFKHVEDPFWLAPLRAEGFFRHPPGLIQAENGNISFPFWWPAIYLAKVARKAPTDVMSVLLEMENTENARVLEKVVEIAVSIPDVSLTLPLEPLINRYIEQPYSFGYEDVSQLIQQWSAAGGAAVLVAIRIARRLIRFHPHPAQVENSRVREEPLEWSGGLGPSPKLQDWEYQRILEEAVGPLTEAAPIETARMLVATVAEMTSLSMTRQDRGKDDWRDFSEVWSAQVDEPSRPYADAKAGLIAALTHACERVYGMLVSDAAALEEFDFFLRNERWLVFERIRHHVYARHLNEMKPHIHEAIVLHSDYADAGYGYEFQRMVRVACEHFGQGLLTQNEATEIFDQILSGPNKQSYKKYWGERFTEENFLRRQQRFWLEQLRPFAAILFGRYKEEFEQIVSGGLIPPTDEDYIRFGVGESKTGASRGPKVARELLAMSDDGLVSFLNEWNDAHTDKKHWWIDIDFVGLAREFRNAIELEPKRFLDWGDRWKELVRPIYLAAAIDTATARLKEENLGELAAWLDVCDWIMAQQDAEPSADQEISDTSENSSWNSARRAVVDFVRTCLDKESTVEAKWRSRIFALLRVACVARDPWLERDEPVVTPRDFLFDAINSTRGRALEHLVDYGWWVRRQVGENEAIPELFNVLELRLTGSPALSIAEHTLLGVHFNRIYGLNPSWTQLHISGLFPTEKIAAWKAGFGAYLHFNRAHRMLFELLHPLLEFAVEHLHLWNDEPEGRAEPIAHLGQHLFAYYIWGQDPSEGSSMGLLEKFYRNTAPKHWASLFDHAGRVLRNSAGTEVRQGIIDRCIEFFENRLAEKNTEELQEFTFWLDAEHLDPAWRLRALSRLLDVTKGRGRSADMLVDRLHTLLDKEPDLVVECFAKLTGAVVSEPHFYLQPNKTKPILRTGLNSGNPSTVKLAKAAQDRLLKAGLSEYLDLQT